MATIEEYAVFFNQPGTRKWLTVSFPNLSVTLTGSDIVEESMEISESLCSEPELRFGSCEASVFKLRIIGNMASFVGETCVVSMVVGGIMEPFVIGTYKVASDKPTADRRFRDIVAYDAMYDIINADVAAWYNDILPDDKSAITLGDFRASFASHFGLEQEEITLPNDEMVVTRTIAPAEISGKDVLAAICELNGCFGHIGRNGKMQYIVLTESENSGGGGGGNSGLFPMNTLYPMDSLFPSANTQGTGTSAITSTGTNEGTQIQTYISCVYEDFTTKQIGKLQIRQEENDVGCIIGAGENSYIIEGNFLVYGKGAAELEAIGQKLFDAISVISYRPATVNAIGNPCLEVGNGIRIETRNKTVETFILERTLKGIQALRDNYYAKGVESYSENLNTVQKSILQLQSKTNTLTRNVEETRSRIEEVNTGYSEIKQTVDEINLSVGDLSNNTNSSIKQLADEISLRVTAEEVDSMIDIAIGEITISASQISLEGYTTINGGFSVDEEGNVELRSANGIETVNMTSDGLRVMSGNVQYTMIQGGKISMFTPILSSHVSVASIDATGNLTLGDGKATFSGLFVNCYNITCSQINGEAPVTRTEFDALAARVTAGGL